MHQWLVSFEGIIRLVFFIGLFSLFHLWETAKPWRQHLGSKRTRLINHFTLTVVSTCLIRAIFPALMVEMAVQTQASDISSLLKLEEFQGLPIWTHYLIGFALLDLLLYLQHRWFHRVPWLWRLHLTHHTDPMLDVTTGIRFHPLEYLFSIALKLFGILLIAPPALVVLIFEVVLNGASLFTHLNVQLPKKWEPIIRWFIVTPEMHRIHHSDLPGERNCNFGFFLSCWDRMFGTYLAKSSLRQDKIILGVQGYPIYEEQTVMDMLKQPFYRRQKKRRSLKAPKFMHESDNNTIQVRNKEQS